MKSPRKLARAAVLTIILSSTIAIADVKTESVPGEYVVRLKKNILNSKTKNNLSSQLGAYIKSTIDSQDIVVVKRAIFETQDSAVKALAQNELVDIAEPNYIYRTSRKSNDPLMENLWGLSNYGQKDSAGQAGKIGVDIDVEKAWDIQTGSKNVLIAVIDTGVDYRHPDLVDNMWTNQVEAAGRSGVDDDNNGVVDDIHGYNAINGKGDPMDDHGHGSHCAGTIGAKGNDGKGIVGVNWDTTIMGVKFLDKNGSGSLENAIKAIDYATKMGAKVLSNSWGGGGFSQTLMDAIKRSNSAGTLFIAAAGNEYNNNDSKPTYPASYDVENVIAVAAIDNKGMKANFSNYGKRTVHLGAPGVNIFSSTGGDYDSWSGTSMATPHVAGVAALVWSQDGFLSAREVKDRLLKSTKPVSGLRGKVKTGGIVNAYNALTNQSAAPDMEDPSNWLAISVNYSSQSPYGKNTDETHMVTAPEGTTEFALYFEKFNTESGYDKVEIYDANNVLVQTLSGSNDDVFSANISGSTAKVVFKSDASVEKTGWSITKLALRPIL